MATYQGSVEIGAQAETVARLLHDLDGWTGWTSTIQEATPLGRGVVEPGARVRCRQPRLPVSVWTVDQVDERTFCWNNYRHGLRTDASHRMTPTLSGCRLDVEITQQGLLTPMVSMVYGRVIQHHLDRMLLDIKRAAESKQAVYPTSAGRAETLDPDVVGGDTQRQQELSGGPGENR